MIPEVDLLSVIYLIGASQGAFLVVALLDKKIANRKANRYLAIFLFIFTLSLIDEFLFSSHYFYKYPHLIGLIWPLDYLYGPLFYFYVRELTSINVPFRRNKDVYHFLPFVFGFALAIPTWVLDPSHKIIMLYGMDGTPPDAVFTANIFDGVATLVVVIQIVVYIRLSFRYLGQYRKSICQQLSEIEQINLSWLVSLLWLLLLLWMLYVVDIFFSEGLGIGDQAGMLLHILLVVIIYCMGYMGLRQPSVFRTEEDSPSVAGSGEENLFVEGEKYSKSKLSEEYREGLQDRLLRVMEEEKPYLENGITLPQLANIVGCTANNLSQVINDKVEKTFFDFVNGYRICYAKQQLLCSDDEKKAILQIAMDAGFNSKSAFYTAFKKEVGLTPTQYRKTM